MIVLAGVLVVATLVVGQDFGPAPIVLREGELPPDHHRPVSGVGRRCRGNGDRNRDRVAALVADVYRTDTQVTETVLDAVADVFATFGLAAEPLAPPETTTTTGATTTSTETTTTGGSETTEGSTTTVETTTTTVPAEPLPRTEQILLVQEAYPLLDDQTIATLVDLINGDIDRVAAGENALFPLVRQEAIDIAEEFLLEGSGRRSSGAVRSELVTVPRPLVLLPDDVRPLAEAALADVVQQSLQANEFRDDGATQLARLEARDAVADLTVDFVAGEHRASGRPTHRGRNPGDRRPRIARDRRRRHAGASPWLSSLFSWSHSLRHLLPGSLPTCGDARRWWDCSVSCSSSRP